MFWWEDYSERLLMEVLTSRDGAVEASSGRPTPSKTSFLERRRAPFSVGEPETHLCSEAQIRFNWLLNTQNMFFKA